jgi:hypothetical protein
MNASAKGRIRLPGLVAYAQKQLLHKRGSGERLRKSDHCSPVTVLLNSPLKAEVGKYSVTWRTAGWLNSGTVPVLGSRGGGSFVWLRPANCREICDAHHICL